MKLMGLIDEDEINGGPLATGDRLDAAHLDRLLAIGALVDALHHADAMNAFRLECGDGLVDEAERGHHERNALSLVKRALDDVRGQQGLPEAGWA